MTELEQIEEGADAPEIEISPYSEEDIETFSKLGIDPDNFTAEDLKRIAKRTVKSESKIVDLKKTSPKKSEERQTQEDPKKLLSDLLDERDFYKSNPDAELYRDKIEEFKSKGLSREQALLLATQKDREIESNREVYGQGAVQGDGAQGVGVSAVSVDTFDSWTPQQQEKYTKDMVAKHGKIKFK